jgi:hypothetical protein
VERYNSDIVGEGAIVRDCRGIGRMRIICEVGITNYLVSGECGGSKDSVGGKQEEDRKVGRKKEKSKEKRRKKI